MNQLYPQLEDCERCPILVSRWAVKPACLVYIPIRREGVYLKRFLILFFKLPLALRAAAMRAAASLPALVRWSRWPS